MERASSKTLWKVNDLLSAISLPMTSFTAKCQLKTIGGGGGGGGGDSYNVLTSISLYVVNP